MLPPLPWQYPEGDLAQGHCDCNRMDRVLLLRLIKSGALNVDPVLRFGSGLWFTASVLQDFLSKRLCPGLGCVISRCLRFYDDLNSRNIRHSAASKADQTSHPKIDILNPEATQRNPFKLQNILLQCPDTWEPDPNPNNPAT